MSIKHKFHSLIADDPLAVLAGKVVPSNWNATLNNDGYIYLSDFGVVGNGIADDTAAINAAFASVVGTGVTVVWDVPSFCKTTDTIVVGAASGGAGAPTSFINILAPRGNQQAGIFYSGPTDGRPALQFAKNKYFYCRGLNINNQGSHGSSVGILLGGSGSGSFGTQVLGGIFDNCNVVNFNVGITDGNFGAASEILWNQLSIISCDTGWIANDFNTLDHVFVMLNMSGCGIGLSTGVSEGWRVYGGSASSSTVTDFKIENNSFSLVSGFRSENARRNVYSTAGGRVTISDCQFRDQNTPWSVSIESTNNFNGLTVTGCELQGWVYFQSLPNIFTMVGNGCRPDPNTNLPFISTGQSDNAGYIINVNSNSDIINFPPLLVNNFSGSMRRVNNNAGNGLLIGCYNDPRFMINDSSPVIAADTLPAPFGADIVALNQIKQLSEAPLKGVVTPYSNTLVTNATTAAGNPDLHFASVPSWVTPGMLVGGTNIPFASYIISKTSTVVTLNANVTGGGVANGATINFYSAIGVPQSGRNLRVMGTFATSATLSFTFKRSFTVTSSGQSQILTASGATFFPTDAGKKVQIAGKGQFGWTDWWGHINEYTDSTHVNVTPAASMQAPNPGAGATATIGEDEPDANYMIVGIIGNATSPESYSITAQSTTGFTVKSSNASSTATVSIMIVR